MTLHAHAPEFRVPDAIEPEVGWRCWILTSEPPNNLFVGGPLHGELHGVPAGQRQVDVMTSASACGYTTEVPALKPELGEVKHYYHHRVPLLPGVGDDYRTLDAWFYEELLDEDACPSPLSLSELIGDAISRAPLRRRLTSPRFAIAWPTDRPLEACCSLSYSPCPHEAPAKCGIHAARHASHALTYGGGPRMWVLGSVELFGKVISGTMASRGEKARVKALVLPKSPDGLRPPHLLTYASEADVRQLAESYRCELIPFGDVDLAYVPEPGAIVNAAKAVSAAVGNVSASMGALAAAIARGSVLWAGADATGSRPSSEGSAPIDAGRT